VARDRGTAIFSLAFVQFWQHTGQSHDHLHRRIRPFQRLYTRPRGWRRESLADLPVRNLAAAGPGRGYRHRVHHGSELQAFDLILALTDGGPSYATEILSTWIYHRLPQLSRRYASAGAVVFMLILAALTAIQFRVLRRQRLSVPLTGGDDKALPRRIRLSSSPS